MSPRFVVFAIVAALVVGLAAGRAFLISPHPAPTENPRAAEQDDAAAASRAMTFTQPKAPGK
ncbi:hypothetical protein HF263_30745 [Rhizobium leguminosarum]|uniref:hypothetical protein n=1 Tax=Rhizobium leguminosarum TaxID=384 RepID=UPI001C91E64C|nr:hypothetical protein [Rhizobium leguminosarum]MBY3060388.1 hypothetical protein [Rhizobium leguminosarum]